MYFTLLLSLSLKVLVVKTQYQPRSVTLRKEEPTSLGLQIQGLSKTGLYVSDLPVGGMAERCGLLRVGDRLLSINETSCGKTNVTLFFVCYVGQCGIPSKIANFASS